MFSSLKYWENRYKDGPNFGNNYDEGVKIKAGFVNKFIKEKGIKKVFDYGCGDGRQSKYIEADEYIGVELSETALRRCKELNPDKKFYPAKDIVPVLREFKPDLCLSLWVISHLTEDSLYEEYMKNLFSSERFVLIHSLNQDKIYPALYQKDRNFTKDIGKEWKLLQPRETCTKYEFIYERLFLST